MGRPFSVESMVAARSLRLRQTAPGSAHCTRLHLVPTAPFPQEASCRGAMAASMGQVKAADHTEEERFSRSPRTARDSPCCVRLRRRPMAAIPGRALSREPTTDSTARPAAAAPTGAARSLRSPWMGPDSRCCARSRGRLTAQMPTPGRSRGATAGSMGRPDTGARITKARSSFFSISRPGPRINSPSLCPRRTSRVPP
jgi:hypothetical protein